MPFDKKLVQDQKPSSNKLNWLSEQWTQYIYTKEGAHRYPTPNEILKGIQEEEISMRLKASNFHQQS